MDIGNPWCSTWWVVPCFGLTLAGLHWGLEDCLLRAVWGLLFSSTSRTRHSYGELEYRVESGQPCGPLPPLTKPIPHFFLICLSLKVFLEMWKQRLAIYSSPLVSKELSCPCADKRATCLPHLSITGGNNDYFLIGAEQGSGESGCYSNFPRWVRWASSGLKEQLAADPSSHNQCQISPRSLSHEENLKSPSPHSPRPSPACLSTAPEGETKGSGVGRLDKI